MTLIAGSRGHALLTGAATVCDLTGTVVYREAQLAGLLDQPVADQRSWWRHLVTGQLAAVAAAVAGFTAAAAALATDHPALLAASPLLFAPHAAAFTLHVARR